jgi:hypothetical protein
MKKAVHPLRSLLSLREATFIGVMPLLFLRLGSPYVGGYNWADFVTRPGKTRAVQATLLYNGCQRHYDCSAWGETTYATGESTRKKQYYG